MENSPFTDKSNNQDISGVPLDIETNKSQNDNSKVSIETNPVQQPEVSTDGSNERHQPVSVPKLVNPYIMMIVVRKDLNLGVGKIAAQVGHALLGAYKKGIKSSNEVITKWEEEKRMKIFSVKSDEELQRLSEEAKKLELNYHLVRDAGKTQVQRGTHTALCIGPVLEAKIEALYKDLKSL
jgi:peptidyl-tRNA hydrolase